MVEMPGTSTSRKRLNQQLEAEIDELGSEQSEAEITDLLFKNVGQVTRYLNKLQRQIQQTMDSIERAYPGNSVSKVLLLNMPSLVSPFAIFQLRNYKCSKSSEVFNKICISAEVIYISAEVIGLEKIDCNDLLKGTLVWSAISREDMVRLL